MNEWVLGLPWALRTGQIEINGQLVLVTLINLICYEIITMSRFCVA